MSYDNLIRLQDAAQLVFGVCLLGGLVFLLLGLVRSRWVGVSSRLRVVLAALGIWILGGAVYAGAIGYTHAQPNGPHSFETYMDGMTAQQCVRDRAAKGCDALRTKCAERDATHPACRILAGEDARKFFSTTTNH